MDNFFVKRIFLPANNFLVPNIRRVPFYILVGSKNFCVVPLRRYRFSSTVLGTDTSQVRWNTLPDLFNTNKINAFQITTVSPIYIVVNNVINTHVFTNRLIKLNVSIKLIVFIRHNNTPLLQGLQTSKWTVEDAQPCITL